MGGTAQCGDIPSLDGELNVAAFALLVDTLKPDVAIVEKVHAFPKQGVSSSFKFGRAFGAIHGVIAAKGIPVRPAIPFVWKRHHQISGSDKNRSRVVATQLYPMLAKDLSRVRDHGRAEALLIARWHVDKFVR
jgi:crossover junction endodeoxyribonuclease RuvC